MTFIYWLHLLFFFSYVCLSSWEKTSKGMMNRFDSPGNKDYLWSYSSWVSSVIHVKVCDLSPVNYKLHSRRGIETWSSKESCDKAVFKVHFLTNLFYHIPKEATTPKLCSLWITDITYSLQLFFHVTQLPLKWQASSYLLINKMKL